MEQNIYVECFSYKLATERFSDVMWAMQQILFMNLDQRLAIFLWDELSRSEGDVIHITHEQIARYIGSAREVVSRMLKYFVADGIVELSRGGIRIIDKKKTPETHIDVLPDNSRYSPGDIPHFSLNNFPI